MRQDGEQVFLTAAEATGVLADGDRIHTFANSAGMLVGADWDRSDVVEHFEEVGEVQVGGAMCRNMGHALCTMTGRRLFFAHDEERLAAIDPLEAAKP